LAVPLNLFAQYQQVVFRQRSVDLFDNPKADRFVTQLWADEFVLFGNAAEAAVKAVALGLVARHKNVTVIRDACGYWDRGSADLSFRLFAAKGVRLMTVDELLIRKLDRQFRYPKFAVGGSLGNNNGRSTRRHNGQPLASPNTSQAPRHLGGHADQAHRKLPFPPDNGKIPRTFDP